MLEALALTCSDEEWRLCHIFGHLYQVSSHGRVMSYHYKRPKIHISTLNQAGYHFVSLCDGGVRKGIGVHRLVCWAFNGPPPSGEHEACHIDGNKLNNTASNMCWQTHLENMRDKFRHGTHLHGESSPLTNMTERDIAEIWAMHETMTRKQIAAATGVSYWTIRDIIGGKRWRRVSEGILQRKVA